MNLKDIKSLSQEDKPTTNVNTDIMNIITATSAADIIEEKVQVYLTKREFKKLIDLLNEEPKKVARFDKVSVDEWLQEEFPMEKDEIEKMVDDIKLPQRSTKSSAGYDFFIPFDLLIDPGREVVIPTGIRAKFINDNYVLKIYPRSGLGFKYKAKLANTVGIIDADYYYSDNEGHIMIKMCNESADKIIKLRKGQAICQGIFVEYGLTEDDDEYVKKVRNGGFGSTGE